MTSPQGRLIALLAHGSPDPRSSSAAHDLAARVAGRLPGDDVRVCFLDHDAPSLGALVGDTAADDVIVVPLFLASAFHLTVDVPRVVDEARADFRGSIRTTAPLGHDARVRRWIDDQLPAPTPLTLATAGTRNVQAQAELVAIAEQWTLERGSPVRPDEFDGTQAVASYVLFPGVIDDRIREAARTRPVSRPLSACPGVVDLIVERIQGADLPR